MAKTSRSMRSSSVIVGVLVMVVVGVVAGVVVVDAIVVAAGRCWYGADGDDDDDAAKGDVGVGSSAAFGDQTTAVVLGAVVGGDRAAEASIVEVVPVRGERIHHIKQRSEHE